MKDSHQPNWKMRRRMKVILYARVSTEDQNVKQQINYLKEWAARNDFKVLKVVSDEESGRLALRQRKRFLRLLETSKLMEDIGILVYNIDRLTRNWDDVTFIENHFSKNWNHCKLISTSDSIDLSNASGRLMFRIKMAVNCFTPEDIREKQIIGIERAKLEGKYTGGTKGRRWSKLE